MMIFGRQNLRWLWKILLISSFITLGLDSYGNMAATEKFFHISSDTIFLVALLLTFFIRYYDISDLPDKLIQVIWKIVFPISFLLGIGLTIWDYLTPANFTFSLFHLNYQKITYIAILSGWLWFWHTSKKWRQKQSHKIFFLSGLIIVAIALIVSLWPFDYFFKLSEEDKLIENTQAISLFIGSIFFFLMSRRLFLESRRFMGILFAFAGVVLFFVCGDEISWGQRLFNIPVPSFFQHYNVQDEITVHNLSWFDTWDNLMFIMVGLYGSCGWIILSRFGRKLRNRLELIVPQWYFFPYFLLGFFTTSEYDCRVAKLE